MNYTDKINDLNPSDAPMAETNFYHWLFSNYLDNRLDCKTAYLESFGFIIGKDTVDCDTLNALGYIHDLYFRTYEVPIEQDKIQEYLDEIEKSGVPVVSTSHIMLHNLNTHYGKDRVSAAVDKYFASKKSA